MKITHITVESTKGWANIARREVAGKVVIGIRGDGAAAWGDRWGWNLTDGGVFVERTAR